MANKITIIGAGQVGSTIAFALTLKRLASEIVLIDIAKDRAMGEAMDIRQGTPFIGSVYVHDGDYSDAKGSDIVILSSGVARKPGQSRLDLAQTNVNITKSIIPEITKSAPDAIYVIVANPVDILTYQFAKTAQIKYLEQELCWILPVSAPALPKHIKFHRQMYTDTFSANTATRLSCRGLLQVFLQFR